MTSGDAPIASAPSASSAALERRAAEPTAAAERVESIDIIRGFALFGILFVNLEAWFRTTPKRYELEPHPWPGAADVAVDIVQGVLFDGKFMSLFSMLFGVGLAIQMERAEARGARFGLFALRRLSALFAFGALHIALLWSGDILHLYAINGALLLFFLRRKTKTVVIWASVLLGLPAVVFPALAIFLHRPAPPPPDVAELREAIASAIRAQRDGTWAELARFRIAEYLNALPFMARIAPIAFAGFLVGLAAWKSGVVKRASEHLPALRRTLVIGLVFGLSASALRVYLDEVPRADSILLWRIVFSFYPLSTMALAMAYASAILLITQSEAWRSRLSPLGYAGRMALTNYLLQSVICSLIFYGIGLGLYDRLGPAAGVLVVITIYAAQLALSRLWLRRFRFGPVEWLWRSLTYWKIQPLR